MNVKKLFSWNVCMFVTLVMSCAKTDWYDVKPDKLLAVPTTIKDMQALMDNADVMNYACPSFGEGASDGHYLTDATAQTLTGYNINVYTWSHDQPYRNIVEWNGSGLGMYVRVFYSNVVLEGGAKIMPVDSNELSQLNEIKGQAFFQRAKGFYELSQVFAPPYQQATADKDLGIPLRLESDINIPNRRSTVRQTYDQIIEDLNSAEKLLSNFPSYKTRPSKQAVFALLSRVYLSMEDYRKAGIYADSCLNIYNGLIDFNSLNATLKAPLAFLNQEVILEDRMYAGLVPLEFGKMLIDTALYALYDKNDLRRDVFFTKSGTEGNITFKGSYSGAEGVIFTGLATDETYLIKAECLARESKIIESMNVLNTLVRKRWKNTVSYPVISATDPEDALRKVLLERRKELMIRGLRWSDLRRLNRDPRFSVSISRSFGGKKYTLEPGSFRYTFPIPDDIIEITGIEQNSGW